MELALQQFITSASKISDITNCDYDNTFIFKLTSGKPGDTEKYAITVSTKEPVTKMLPLFGVWLNLDANSKYYKQALKLVGYSDDIYPETGSLPEQILTDGGFSHYWIIVHKYSNLFSDVNIYVGDKGPVGDLGLIGLDGPAGLQGLPGALDYPNIIINSVNQYTALLT